MKEEPNYCFDTLSGGLDCATTIGPALSSDLMQPDFPWLHAIVALFAIISQL